MTSITTWVGPADQDAALESLVAQWPEVYEQYQDFGAHLWNDGLVSPVLIELTRLRIAQLLGCRTEQRLRYEPARRAGLTEEKIAAIPQYSRSEHFSALERASIELAEQFVIDATSITDGGVAAVADHLGPAATVALFNAMAWYDGVIRTRIAFGVGDVVGADLVYIEPGRSGSSVA